MSLLGGLWRPMPWTAGLFALGAAAICGLPPLNGFVSEWLVYLGLFDALNSRGAAALLAVPAVVLLAMTGALALACFIKVCGVVFLGAARSGASERARECGPLMRGPMLVLAAACVAIGLAPAALLARRGARRLGVESGLGRPGGARLAGRDRGGERDPGACLGRRRVAAVAAHAASNGLRRAPTWDCGYAAPTARMQYTAGSFAGIVTEWFAWILRPRRQERRPEGAFPTGASLEEHTPETVLEHVVEPAGAVSAASCRCSRGASSTGGCRPTCFTSWPDWPRWPRWRSGEAPDERAGRSWRAPPLAEAKGRPARRGRHAMYLNLIQIAESFGVSETVVEDWIRNEGLPHTPDRGRLLFDRVQVANWAAARGLGAKAGFLALETPALDERLAPGPAAAGRRNLAGRPRGHRAGRV